MNVSKALVVDDSKVVRVVLKRMLEARGLGVDTAASGQEALDYLLGNAPDVIFMDFMMDGMDGYEATSLIRANVRTSTIPVVMCTGNDTPQERSRAHECGASAFVTKPVAGAALDVVLAQLREHAAAAAPLAGTLTVPVEKVSVSVPAEDTAGIAERIAHDVAERLVREAVESLSAAAEQTSRSLAHAAASSATEDALAAWRDEMARARESTEQAASAAAERTAETALRQVNEHIEAARRLTETIVDEKLLGALSAVSSTAERVARETLDSTRAGIDDASRQALEAARAGLEESARIAAEAAARPVAETAARAVADEIARHSLAAAREHEATLRTELEQRAIAAAEQAAQTVVQQAIDRADAERATTGAIADETLREALATVQATAERVARETLDASKAGIEERSREAVEAAREAIDAARSELSDTARIAAEAAAKPVAEAAAREAIEQFARETLAAVIEREAESRRRVEEATIAVAERVGRELVQLAFSAAASNQQAAADSARAVAPESALQDAGTADTQRSDAAVETTSTPSSRQSAGSRTWMLLPWLIALTVAVLYLLGRGFL